MISLLLLVLATTGQLTLVASAPLPIEPNSHTRGAYWAKPPNDSLVFMMDVIAPSLAEEIAIMRYDAATKKVERLPVWLGFQESCDDGLVTVYRSIENAKTREHEFQYVSNIDVATGKELSRFEFQIERVGNLGWERNEPNRPRLYDVTTGKELRKVGRYPRREGYIGRMAWDDGKIRMFATQTDRGGTPREGFIIYRALGDGFERGPEFRVISAALGFDKIVGNPSEPFFVVQFSNNLRPSFKTYTREYEETPFQADYVYDVSPFGVLGRMITDIPEYGDPKLGKLGCWDPMTGKLRWQSDVKEYENVVWLNQYALIGSEIREPSTGKVVATLPEGRIFAAARDTTIWLVIKDSPAKLEVWRMN